MCETARQVMVHFRPNFGHGRESSAKISDMQSKNLLRPWSAISHYTSYIIVLVDIFNFLLFIYMAENWSSHVPTLVSMTLGQKCWSMLVLLRNYLWIWKGFLNSTANSQILEDKKSSGCKIVPETVRDTGKFSHNLFR